MSRRKPSSVRRESESKTSNEGGFIQATRPRGAPTRCTPQGRLPGPDYAITPDTQLLGPETARRGLFWTHGRATTPVRNGHNGRTIERLLSWTAQTPSHGRVRHRRPPWP